MALQRVVMTAILPVAFETTSGRWLILDLKTVINPLLPVVNVSFTASEK